MADVDVPGGANDALIGSSTTPCGPTSTQPGVPSMLPLCRTGASTPSEIESVNASSTWLKGRVGPKTRTVGSIRRRGPTSMTVSSAA